MLIHKTAIIDSTAELADDVEIGPYTVIGAEVRIDEATWIGPHVVVKGPTHIGKGNKIYQFASLGDAPQDMKFVGERTELIIGDRNSIREFCTFNRGTKERGATTIGDDNWFMAYCHIAHDCAVGSNTVFANNASLAGHVTVEDHAVLGGFTSVHQFCRIGQHAFCGLGSVVTLDIPPFVIAAGNHAVPHGINKEGLKRRGFSSEVIRALHTAYRLIVKSRKPRAVVMEEVSELTQKFSEVAYFVEFVDNSVRGIVR